MPAILLKRLFMSADAQFRIRRSDTHSVKSDGLPNGETGRISAFIPSLFQKEQEE